MRVRRPGIPQLPAVAVLVASTPIVVATVRALVRGWTPLGDNGLLLLRTQDVLTANHPLLGTWTSASISAGRNINNPGPLFFDFLAPFVKAAGPSVGFAVGVFALNVAAVVIAAWAAYRAGGEGGAVAVTALSAGLAWSMGSELLFDAWQPHSMLLPFWALLVLGWCVAHGDLAVLPWALGVASLLVQTHLSYAYLVPLLVVGTVVVGVITRRRSDGTDRPFPARRTVALSAFVVVAAWVQPVIDQIAGRGNLRRLLEAGDSGGPRLGAGLGTRLVAAVVALPPWWTRPGFSSTVETETSVAGPDGPVLPAVHLPGRVAAVVGLLAVATVIVVAVVIGRRRGDTRLRALAVVAGLAVVGSLVSTTLIPVGIGISPHQMRWLWPVSAFVTLTLAMTVAVMLTLRPRTLAIAGLGSAVVLAVLTLPTYVNPQGPTADRDNQPSLAALLDQLDDYRPDGPVLFDPTGLRFAEPNSGPVIAALARNDVDVVAHDETMVGQMGDRRRADGTERRRVVLYEGETALSPPAGGRVLAMTRGLTAEQQDELDSVRAEVIDLAASNGLRLSERGLDVRDDGRLGFGDVVLSPGGDAAALEADGWITFLVSFGYVELPPDLVEPFERYTDLALRRDKLTVALVEYPIELGADS